MPAPIVIRSRLRSATEDPPRPLETPPPNMSERPPPLPLWSRISRIIRRLVMMSRTVRAVITEGTLLHVPEASEARHVVEAADATELVGVQAGPADQGT